MILSIIYLYLSILIGVFLSSVTLIFCGLSWGKLPFHYLKLVSSIQQYFPFSFTINSKNDEKRINSKNGIDLSDITLDLTTSGVESIVNEGLASCFSQAPTSRETLLRFKPYSNWNPLQKMIFYICVIFRVSFLLPVRTALLLSSFVFVAFAGFFASFKKLTNRQKTWVAIIYCRLFCSSMGLVATYRGQNNRPKRPGVAVSNHLTPNDIQILFAGTPHGSSYGYVVTGQKHSGIIGLIEHLVEKLCPSLWLERKCTNERQNFLCEVLNIAKKDGPVLLFPEGYCSNNTQVLQFRKAIFEDNVNIYPIAIKQTPEFGDGFWFEDKFHNYLFRSMTSWALVYDIQYLDVQTRLEEEDNADFAQRVQKIIADAADIPPCEYGGNVWYKNEDRQKLKEALQQTNAQRLTQLEKKNKIYWETKPIIENIDSVIDSQYEKLITIFS